MDTKKVKDMMVPLDEYPVVPEEATLLDAVIALEAETPSRRPSAASRRAGYRQE